MRSFRFVLSAISALCASTTLAQSNASLECDCMTVDGQPAADVLASEDIWGNPTFIGGVTNKGPESGSVW